jgi:hypothetical protein
VDGDPKRLSAAASQALRAARKQLSHVRFLGWKVNLHALPHVASERKVASFYQSWRKALLRSLAPESR